MNYRQRALLLIVLVAAGCGAAVWGVAWWRARSFATTAALLEHVPDRNAAVLFIDFAGLRQVGILDLISPSGIPQEPEYKAFVESTQFDYTRDLDTAILAFTPEAKYFLLRGRFEWPKLLAYARRNGGNCNYTFCYMAGSTPDRRISYLPLRPDVMALAVAPSNWAASQLTDRHGDPGFDAPPGPVWLTIPGPVLGSLSQFSEGARMFASTLSGASRVTLALGPRGRDYEARMDVRCRSARDAAALETQLQRTTTLLQAMITRENHAPDPRDLSGVLTGGQFRQDGVRVLGSWPVSRGFLEQALGGS